MEEEIKPVEPPTWSLFIDSSSEGTSSGAGIVPVSLEGHKLNCVMRFDFKATNNVAKYEAFLVGLRLAKEIWVKRLLIISDSLLVVSQVNGNFSTKDKSMAAYLKLVMEFVPTFERFKSA